MIGTGVGAQGLDLSKTRGLCRNVPGCAEFNQGSPRNECGLDTHWRVREDTGLRFLPFVLETVVRAVVFDGQLHFTRDAVLRTIQPGEVAVDILHAGICERDMQLCQGYMGFRGIPGQEIVGISGMGRGTGRRVGGMVN